MPSIEYEDIIPERGILNKVIYNKPLNKKGIQFKENDILFGKLRPYLKNWIFANCEGVAVGDFWVLTSTNTDSRFIYYLIQTNAFQAIANQSTGTKMPRSDWSLVSNTSFKTPFIKEEQTRIGLALNKLDNLITLHQRKYNNVVKENKNYDQFN